MKPTTTITLDGALENYAVRKALQRHLDRVSGALLSGLGDGHLKRLWEGEQAAMHFFIGQIPVVTADELRAQARTDENPLGAYDPNAYHRPLFSKRGAIARALGFTDGMDHRPLSNDMANRFHRRLWDEGYEVVPREKAKAPFPDATPVMGEGSGQPLRVGYEPRRGDSVSYAVEAVPADATPEVPEAAGDFVHLDADDVETEGPLPELTAEGVHEIQRKLPGGTTVRVTEYPDGVVHIEVKR